MMASRAIDNAPLESHESNLQLPEGNNTYKLEFNVKFRNWIKRFMANVYIPFMENVIKTVDSTMALGPHYIPFTTTIDTSYYRAMAWCGLTDTPAYIALPDSTKNKYDNTQSREAYLGAGCN